MGKFAIFTPQRRRFAAVAGVMAAIAAVPLANLAIADSARIGLERAADALGLIEMRSPGERSGQELAKIKRPIPGSGIPDSPVRDRALGKVLRPIPPAGEGAPGPQPEGLVTIEVPPAAMEVGTELAGLPDQYSGTPGGGAYAPPVFTGGFGGGGGGGPGGGGGENPGVDPDPLPPTTTPGPDPTPPGPDPIPPGPGPVPPGPDPIPPGPDPIPPGPGPIPPGPGPIPPGPGPVPPPPDPVAPVPEPGTWGMMIIGMGLCGFALRRRSRPSARPRTQ